jgi:hypothetical protein
MRAYASCAALDLPNLRSAGVISIRSSPDIVVLHRRKLARRHEVPQALP